MFEILLIISIFMIVLGIILAIATVSMFFKQNMAVVYDALYDRGYTEKLERRKNKKNKNTNNTMPNMASSRGAKDDWTGKTIEQVHSGNTGNVAPKPMTPAGAPVPQAPVGAAPRAATPYNSGDTVMLQNSPNANMANSGATTVLNANQPSPAGQTTLLSDANDEFKILKTEQFTDTDELI